MAEETGNNSYYVTRDGQSVFTGDQSMGDHKLTDVGEAVNDGDAIRKSQLEETVSDILNTLISPYKTVNGDNVFTTNQSMGSNRITNVGDAVNDTDVINKGQIEEAVNLAVSSAISSISGSSKKLFDGRLFDN